MVTKQCRKCGQEKELDDFAKAPRNKDGRHSYCRECMVEYRRKRDGEVTPEQRAARNESRKKWAQNNPERVRESQRRWRERVGAEYFRDWRERNPDKAKQHSRKTVLARYGLTPEDYDEMLVSQEGQCGICGVSVEEDDVLRVDHDHATGEVRGLLCHACNVGLGLFRDDPEILERAIRWLSGSLKDSLV